MPVSKDYAAYVIEQLQGVNGVTTRRMFGGIGIYSNETFFALISRDTLYFKVHDATRGDFETRGMLPFRPTPDLQMSYFEVPADALEDADELALWARRAIAVASRAAQRKPKSRTVAKTKR